MFGLMQKWSIQSCSSIEYISACKISWYHINWRVFYSRQRFERTHFERFKLRDQKLGFQVIFNGMSSLLNFTKVDQLLQTLIREQTERKMTSISLPFSIVKESMLINGTLHFSFSGEIFPSLFHCEVLCHLYFQHIIPVKSIYCIALSKVLFNTFCCIMHTIFYLTGQCLCLEDITTIFSVIIIFVL